MILGRFVLTAASRVVWTDTEQRRVAVTLADQTAAAMAAVSPPVAARGIGTETG